MKPSAKVVEPTWDRSYRDQTPSEADLSDYDPGFIATANLDISNRFDLTEFTRTPFTIAQGRAAKAKSKPTPPIQPPNTKADGKKEEMKGKSKPKKSIPDKENIQDTKDDDIKKPIQDTKEDTEDPLNKKKKKEKKLRFGGYSSYAEWNEAEERAARAGGPPIIPAAIQLPPAKKDEKKRYSNNSYPPGGWLDARGRSKGPSKPFPKTGFTTAAALAGASNQSKKRKTPAVSPPPAPSILQQLDAVDKDKVKRPKIAKAAEKKEPVKRGKAAAKGTGTKAKGKGKGKKDSEEAEPSLKFGRLPAGAGPTDDFPIIKGFERMKSLPVKQRPVQVDLDKLIPSTKKELDKNKNNKNAPGSKNKTFKSAEIILDDDDDNESIDPPSDTDATLHASSATLKGSSKPKWFSALFENVPQQVKLVPSPDQINRTVAVDGFFTPEAGSQCDNDDPSTMTHVSTKPHISDYATSSSQLPYSSPVVGKYGRSGNVGIINPIPIRDKSSQIAHLQKMVNQGQSRQTGYIRNSLAAPAPLGQYNPDKTLISSFPEDDEIKEEEEEWSTIRKPSRYASKSMNRKDDYSQSSARPMTALFPQQGPTQQDRKPVPASRFSKITVFQPPTRPAQPTNSYTIAAIPNGARKIDQQQQQYQVDEMQWTGTPRRNMELLNPKPKDLSYLRTAEAARPDPGEDWKNEWKGQKVKRDISNNSLGGYALKKDIKRGEIDGQGRAFKL